MPIFETPGGSRMDLLLPGGTPWDDLNKVIAEYKVLLRHRKAAGQRLGAVARAQEQAVRKDLEALKEALLAGKDDPGPVHEEKAKKEAEAARRRYDALDLALEDAERKLIDVIDAHRDEWVAEVEAQEEKAREEFELVVEELSAKRSRLAFRRGMKYWLQRFPDQPSFRFGVGPVRALTAPHGDPYMWDQVVSALLNEAQPSQPSGTPLGFPVLPVEASQA